MRDEMEHARAAELLSELLDRELDAETRRAVQLHLAGCSACRAELQALRRTVAELGGLRGRAPSRFLPALQERLRQRSRGRFFATQSSWLQRLPLAWLSLLMLLAMLAYYLLLLQEPARLEPLGPAP